MDLKLTTIYEQNAAAWLGGKRRALNEGGTSSSKTYSILQTLILIAKHARSQLLVSVVSESMPHLKRGCIRDFINILGDEFESSRWNKSDFIYHWPKAEFEFFSADQPAKLRGGRRKILFINECNNVAYDSFQELDIRTELFTFLDWNPVSEFWAHEKGLIKDSENTYIHSTYQDAKWVLPTSVVANIEARKDKDPNWWNVYGLGRLGKIEGLVYPYFEQIDEMPGRGDKVYGLDFGFSGDPAVLTLNEISPQAIYSDELFYETNLTNQDIIIRLSELGVKKSDEIFADSAEPKSIEEIHRAGYNIKPCTKGEGSVEYGHQKVRQLKQYWTKRSLSCIKEQRNFRYIADKNGKLTEKTTHLWSHGCLVAGTMIETSEGQKPIETIKIGDLVLTRKGYFPVVDCGMTQLEAEVKTVKFSNGSSITGTLSHPIFVKNKGFIPLDSCRYGDIIEVCRKKHLSIREFRSTDTLNHQIGQTRVTTKAVLTISAYTFIKKSGRMLTERYQKVAKYITKTKTHLITQLRTLRLCLFTNTKQVVITRTEYTTLNDLLESNHLPKNGTAPRKVLRGIESTLKPVLSTDRQLERFVSSAGSHSSTCAHCLKINSAQMLASRRGVENQGLITKHGFALFVRNLFRLINIAILRPVQENVQVVSLAKPKDDKQPVYNLTVDAVPEYFANGILVHNCDSRRYALVGSLERKPFFISRAN